MKKEAIQNIKDSFTANPKSEVLFHNEFGHCFTAGGVGLSQITREEADKLTEEKEGTPEDTDTGGKGSGKKKR